tara:strand:- start:3795 stop:4010 length:216 start_codon:yes stop_codon:yes gene_type:complete
MKELVIYLILAKGTLLPINIFDTSCYNWYNKNVEIKEKIIKLKNQNHYVHKYNGKVVFGYVCTNRHGRHHN